VSVVGNLFVAEGDDLEGVREPLAARGQILDDRQSGERAIIAVVAAGVTHRVDMRAQHQGRRLSRSPLVAGDHVAGGVDAGRNPGVGAPADESRGRAPVRVGDEEARQAAGFVGEGGERVEPRHEPRAGGALCVGQAQHYSSGGFNLSQRARTARSLPVIWLKFIGGIA
jgi:hypothetical protein